MSVWILATTADAVKSSSCEEEKKGKNKPKNHLIILAFYGLCLQWQENCERKQQQKNTLKYFRGVADLCDGTTDKKLNAVACARYHCE